MANSLWLPVVIALPPVDPGGVGYVTTYTQEANRLLELQAVSFWRSGVALTATSVRFGPGPPWFTIEEFGSASTGVQWLVTPVVMGANWKISYWVDAYNAGDKIYSTILGKQLVVH